MITKAEANLEAVAQTGLRFESWSKLRSRPKKLELAEYSILEVSLLYKVVPIEAKRLLSSLKTSKPYKEFFWKIGIFLQIEQSEVKQSSELFQIN